MLKNASFLAIVAVHTAENEPPKVLKNEKNVAGELVNDISIKQKKLFGIPIKESKIEGLGVFATKDIMANTDLGISHVYDERFPDNYIRLPLGAFINHHEMPNCNAIVSESHESIGKIKHINPIIPLVVS